MQQIAFATTFINLELAQKNRWAPTFAFAIWLDTLHVPLEGISYPMLFVVRFCFREVQTWRIAVSELIQWPSFSRSFGLTLAALRR